MLWSGWLDGVVGFNSATPKKWPVAVQTDREVWRLSLLWRYSIMACFPLTINLCQSLPLPRTPCAATHTLRCAQTNACLHACTPPSHRHCGGSLIMQLILSDSDMYNGRFPGGSMCQSTHPSHTPLPLLFIILPT